MRFGGHETFAIREGWLHKGLRLLSDEPNLLVDENAADWLGVGRNMAKSIRHTEKRPPNPRRLSGRKTAELRVQNRLAYCNA